MDWKGMNEGTEGMKVGEREGMKERWREGGRESE
jgi:hypothetical protein